jgi:hypothetical protein
MSSKAYWHPKVTKLQGPLDDNLKRCLQKRYGNPLNCILSVASVEFLHGLSTAGVEGAFDLAEAIEKYEAIILEEKY